MMRTHRAALAFAASLPFAGAFGCNTGTKLVAQCQSDSDCATHYRCLTGGPLQGSCGCADDSVCSQDAGPAMCNGSGVCQTIVGCSSNVDCPPGLFCDTRAGQCLKGPDCGSDLDCPLGEVCDRSHLCVAGCHSQGDCGGSIACVCGNGAACQCPPADGGFIDPAGFDRGSCELGICAAGSCANDTSLCPYGQNCVGPDGGTCQPDPRSGVLCQPCAGQVGPSSSCQGPAGSPEAQGANFCLIDLHGSNLFCGVDCGPHSQNQSCPSGYVCANIIVLTQTPCTNSGQCGPSSIACNPQGQPDGGTGCPTDAVCAGTGTVGHCAGSCLFDEGNSQGFCSCVTDSDCPHDTCDPSARTCTISQKSCDPNNASTCDSAVSCIDLDGAHGCFIGRNCAPGKGLHCPLNARQ